MNDFPMYRAVVADDAAHLRTLLRILLERSGRFHVVGEAANGKEALRAAVELSPDLTLLDLKMPVMDGLTALPLIRERAPGTTVVVLSGLDAKEVGAQALAAGAAAYLVKGLNLEHLVDQLVDLLDTREEPRLGPAEELPSVLSLPEDLTSAAAARVFVRDTLRHWDRDAVVDEATLLATELVTNAVVHARSAVELRLQQLTDRIRVEVADTGAGALRLRQADPDELTGRGLLLVQEMSLAWGTSSDGAKKIVWFEV